MTDPSGLAAQVAAARASYGLPPQALRRAEEFAHSALALLFPHFAQHGATAPEQVAAELAAVRAQLGQFLQGLGMPPERVVAVAGRFIAALPRLRVSLAEDAEATCEADPAAHGLDEVVLAYPGFFALACQRLAHVLHLEGVALLPRLVTEFAHRETGIDIHPGAVLGRALTIDHGTGIVIGETTLIGDRVKLYQGVTLGALSVRKDLARQKRHPTIEDDVVIYANATILGGDTVIGAGSVIGGNVWLTHSVPPRSIVTHSAALEHPRAPDDSNLEYYL